MGEREFQREIRVYDGYDRRDEGKGAHGMELHFVLHGPLGAIDAGINTGWVARPLVAGFVRGGVAQRRRDEPGVDARLVYDYPTGSSITSHCAEKREDWWFGPDECDIVGGPCYGDTGYLVADTFLRRLLGDGREAAWEFLRELHDSWLSPANEAWRDQAGAS